MEGNKLICPGVKGCQGFYTNRMPCDHMLPHKRKLSCNITCDRGDCVCILYNQKASDTIIINEDGSIDNQ